LARHPPSGGARGDAVVAAAQRARLAREQGYRAQALKLFPHVCARCGRAFEGERLRELTVHHKDHDHDRNPPDGSNWELLCLYCHDAEHQRREQQLGADPAAGQEQATHRPFAALAELLKKR
jgi:hypothetical protein